MLRKNRTRVYSSSRWEVVNDSHELTLCMLLVSSYIVLIQCGHTGHSVFTIAVAALMVGSKFFCDTASLLLTTFCFQVTCGVLQLQTIENIDDTGTPFNIFGFLKAHNSATFCAWFRYCFDIGLAFLAIYVLIFAFAIVLFEIGQLLNSDSSKNRGIIEKIYRNRCGFVVFPTTRGLFYLMYL